MLLAGRSERHRKPCLQQAQGRALHDLTEAPPHGTPEDASGPDPCPLCLLTELANHRRFHELSSLLRALPAHRRISELRCRELRAQLGTGRK